MKTVILDAGHDEDTWESGGGKGVRVDGKDYEEYHANKDVTNRIKKILEHHGVKVVLVSGSLTNRTNTAARIRPDMFISIHQNAGVHSANGACVFAWKGATNSNRMADLVVKYFKEAGIPLHGNGRHHSEYGSWTELHITRELAEANLPGVLIEHGFMTNKVDFENIFGKNADVYRQKCAEADAKAALEYLGIKYKGEVTIQQKTKEEEDMLDVAIVVNSLADVFNAKDLYAKYNTGVFFQGQLPKKQFAKHVIVCGGDKKGIKADKITDLSGKNRLETAAKINSYLK